MFDIGWTEMLVIAVIAIVVVGPKDLPRMMRTVGQYVGKAKRMAREFQSQFDDAVRESELDEVRKSFNDLKSANPNSEIGKAVNPLKEAADDLKKTVEKSSAEDDERYGDGFENSIAKPAAKPAIDDRPDISKPEPAPKTESASEPDTVSEPRAAASRASAEAAEKPAPKADEMPKSASRPTTPAKSDAKATDKAAAANG